MTTHSEKLAAALDPTTPSEILGPLADDPDPAIPRALAANPNTPEAVLQRLWESHPEGILENPILTMWEFTRSQSIVDQVGAKALLLLFNHLRSSGAEPPPSLFTPNSLRDILRSAVFRRDPDVFAFAPFEEDASCLLPLLENPARHGLFVFFDEHAPDAVWMRLATHSDPEIRLSFAELLRSGPYDARPPTRPVLAQAARALLDDGRPEVHTHLAHCHLLPPDLVDRLAASPSAETREPLARCLLAEPTTLRRLAADPATTVRLSLARHRTEPAIHHVLLRDPAEEVRLQLAQNPGVTREILELFDPCDTPKVVRAVFLSCRADHHLRARLLREADPAIQNVVLQMGSSYTPAFHRMIKSLLTEQTLASLAEAHRLARPIVEELARHPSPRVRLGVARRLSSSYNRGSTPANLALLKTLAADPDPDVRHQICIDPRLDKQTTAALFSDPDPAIREKCVQDVLDSLETLWRSRRLASYQHTYERSATLVTALARDPAHAVRLAIAEASEAPPAAKGILFNDPSIRDAFLDQTHWPYGVLLDLEKRLGPEAASLQLRHGRTTPSSSALRLLAKSRNPFVRILTARCRRTPMADLQKLATDPHASIRQAATRTLALRHRK